MMERYQRKFVEEAKELLGKLEYSLLELEHKPDSSSIINEIFRVLHSLKGSGAMFGFSRISSLSHDLETVYSAIRSGQLIVSKFLIDVSFEALDLTRELLKGVEGESEIKRYKVVMDQIQTISRSKTEFGNEIPARTQENLKLAESSLSEESSIWLIQFQPHEDILTDGNNPLYMLDELATMGEMISVPLIDKLPSGLSSYNPQKLFIGWNILLTTNCSEESIYNVFLFIQDQSEIKITCLTSAFTGKISERTSQIKNLLFDRTVDVQNLQSIFVEQKTPDNNEKTIKPDGKQKEIKSVGKVNSGIEDSGPSETDEITIRVPSAKLDELMNLVSELITAQGQLATISENLKHPGLSNLSEKYEKLIRQLREQSMEMSLVSINTLTVRFKRLVRDLSQSLGKEIKLVVEGGETELDKTIIEHLSDPLLHIIRNSIDHGIETPAERKQIGKSETGEIRIRAYYSGAEVHIEISDDGKGIKAEDVIKRALERNLIDPGIRLSDKEALKLLCKPGFSMKDSISEYSGRGVGMDVVTNKITELRGDVEISSQSGMYTKILIKLPLTLTIMDGLLAEVGLTKYIVPVSAVRKIYETSLQELKNAFNNLINLEGRQYPFLLLSKEFDGKVPDSNRLQLILVEYEDQRMGLVVDRIVGERQVVLKPLGTSLKKNRMFSGGSIMGDGEIALVLDTNKLIKEFTKTTN